MTQSIHLSKRLTKVASFLPKGTYFADIGSDHAYLPCFVCLGDSTAKAVAGEINEGPYESARKTVNLYQLSDVITVRLGDGLEVIKNDPVTEVVIAGMGGPLIKRILESGHKSLHTVRRIIAQPNIAAKYVREWFTQNGYTITDESILEENNHIYEIIVADKTEEISSTALNEKQLLFGPILLDEKSNVFYKKWKSEKEKLQKVIDQMKKATTEDKEKMEQYEMELHWVEEVLMYESNHE